MRGALVRASLIVKFANLSIPDIMRYIVRLLWTVSRRAGPSQISVIAAGVAFYSLLAVFPAITAVLALAGLFIDPDAVVAQFETIAKVVPEDAAHILIGEATKVAGASDGGLSIAVVFGIGFAIYLSTRATTALIHGLNVAHERTENRGFFRYWGTVFGLTASLVFGTALMFVLLVVAPTLLAVLPADVVPVSTADLVRALRWVLLGVLLIFGLSVLYRIGPANRAEGTRRRRPWRWVTPGSTLAAALWFAGSFGFSVYVASFADYTATFGSLGGVIVLLTWLWLSAYVVLLGAILDAEWRKLFPQTE